VVAYDADLAARVRALVDAHGGAVERAMFGGLAFMVNTHMACGVLGDGLLVRVGPDAHERAIGDGARPMDTFGRPMRGMVLVPAERVADDGDLADWVLRGVAFAASLPPKTPARKGRGPGSPADGGAG
jgi:hypothetical protein